MKKIGHLFLCFFFVFSFLIFNHSLTQAKWQIEILDTEDDVGQYTSIAIDKDNNPHISYCGFHTENELKYISWNGTSWNEEVVAPLNVIITACACMEIDKKDNPHISYCKGPGSWSLKYADYNGDFWNIEEIESIIAHMFSGISLAMDGNNCSHISYVESFPGDPSIRKLKYTWWDGYSWEGKETIDCVYRTTKELIIADTSLALDTNYDAHVSYYYNDGTNCGLKYVKGKGSSWPTPEFVDQAGNVGKYSSLKLDSSENICISYYDIENKTLKYATKKVGLAWFPSTIDFSGDVGQYTSLQIDSNDNPHISYYDAANGHLKYAYKNGSSPWAIEIVDAEGNVGQYSSLALDEKDHPHISYYDETNGDLKYAKWIPTYFIKGYVKTSYGLGVEGVTLILSGDASGSCVSDVNGYYRFLNLNPSGSYVVTIDKTKWGFNPVKRIYQIVDANQENQNFIGAQIGEIDNEIAVHNYPNPCRRGKGTTFVYTLQESNDVSLNIYTDLGEFVRTVVDSYIEPGTYEAEWNGKDIHGNQMEAGLYFVVLKVGNNVTKNALIILP